MARARNIKPSFFLNEELSEVPYEARLFFIGLWCLCDPQGKMEFRPKRVKVELFPYDNVDCTMLAQCLHQAGLIKFYTVDSQDYIWVPMFTKHQTPHFKESIKGYPDYSECYDIALDKPSASTVQAPPDILIADMLNPDVLNEECAPKVAELEKPKAKDKRNATSLTSFEKQFGEYPTIISNELWSYGKERGLDADRVESVWTAFCDWHVAKNSKWAGARGWKLAWGNWCARQTDRQPSQQRGGNSQQPSKLAAISSQVLAGMLDKQGMAGGASGTHAGTGTANTAGHDGNLQALEASEPEWLRG